MIDFKGGTRRNYSVSLSENFHFVLKNQAAKQGKTISGYLEDALIGVIKHELLVESQVKKYLVQNVAKKRSNEVVLSPEAHKCITTVKGFPSPEAAAATFITMGANAWASAKAEKRAKFRAYPVSSEEEDGPIIGVESLQDKLPYQQDVGGKVPSARKPKGKKSLELEKDEDELIMAAVTDTSFMPDREEVSSEEAELFL